MLIKNKKSLTKPETAFFKCVLVLCFSMLTVQAQAKTPPDAGAENFTVWYFALAALVIGAAGAIYWRYKKSGAPPMTPPLKSSLNSDYSEKTDVADGEKELERLRKNQRLQGKKPVSNVLPKNSTTTPRVKVLPDVEPINLLEKITLGSETPPNQPQILPIFTFNRLELTRPFDALAISDDQDLMSAVEQSYEEFEDDDEVRELAVRILAVFRTRNSVDALSQIALYDLSSGLRSKAVNVLSEFDHESVFETILLANADPSREVRAAAARGLTKLTFDRADAWARIGESGAEGSIAQAARAATESGFVDMSFDRLVSRDRQQAYEAFTLMALLIKAGELEKIFNAFETNRDMNVRRAILHIIKVTADEKALERLLSLHEKNSLPAEIQTEVEQTIEEIGLVAA